MINKTYFKKKYADKYGGYNLKSIVSKNGLYSYSFIIKNKTVSLINGYKFTISKIDLLKELNQNNIKVVKNKDNYKVYLKVRD
ncbi:MAG: hypothetical protein IAC58_00635 [Firmicutes bacterium]|uniref:Uncharacterized protein n=1 Tax=Candidatus Onthovivens merdipullorum TaxID=2840889 RepID=A0A9D9GVU3_9BACL|nr:hypothetical protein [Candidatus Onthovivens merdipullorum]